MERHILIYERLIGSRKKFTDYQSAGNLKIRRKAKDVLLNYLLQTHWLKKIFGKTVERERIGSNSGFST